LPMTWPGMVLVCAFSLCARMAFVVFLIIASKS